MNNISLGQYKSFLHFVKERITEIKDLDIQIIKGEQFSTEKICDYFVIDTQSSLNPVINLMTSKYFENKISKYIYLFESHFNEFFVLLHEVGHIVTRHLYNITEMQQEYNFLNSNKYNTVYEAYETNRRLPIETLADNFAIDFTNKYFYEIVEYFTGMSKEDADNFISILN